MLNADTRSTPRHVSGFVNLSILLLLAVALTAAATGYLLRHDTLPKPAAASTPAPYRVLVQDGSAISSVGSDGSVRSLPATAIPGTLRRYTAEPGGSGMVVASTSGNGDRLYVLRRLGQQPQELALPPNTYGSGPWRVVDSVWAGPADVVALLVNGGSGGGAILARYSVDQAVAHPERWTRLAAGAADLVALSPRADQVAQVEIQAPAHDFAGQVQLRLSQVSGARFSVALRYFGMTKPTAILWSPDGGTLAIEVAGQGLAIQKSSGRVVRQVPQGIMPAAFSPRGASIAYLSGTAHALQIHVLNLHGEVDHQLTAPTNAPPADLAWTPDAKALLYRAGQVLWQLDPTTGSATKLAVGVTGAIIGAVPSTSVFAR